MPSSTVLPELVSSYTIVYWGLVVSMMLFGVSLDQCVSYFVGTGAQDSRTLQFFILSQIVLDIGTSVLAINSIFYVMIVNDGNLLVAMTFSKSSYAEYFLTVVVIYMSQLFYASRIYIVKKPNWSISASIALLATFSFGFGMNLFVNILSVGGFYPAFSQPMMQVANGLYMGTSAVTDLLATVAMSYFLASQRSTFRSTSSILRTLLFLTMNRGILVTVAQFGHMLSFATAPSEIYWLPFHLCMSKLHVITLLTMLNSRDALREKAASREIEIMREFAFPKSDRAGAIDTKVVV